MLNRYKVSAQVDSAKFGKGELIAYLDHEAFVKYANLSDPEKLPFLKEHGAQLQVDLDEVTESDVTQYKVNGEEELPISNRPISDVQSTRKMRMNINGQDTGWVDITEENEAQYNEMMNQFNQMHQRFNERFNRIFGESFFRPLGLMDEQKSIETKE